jgi:tetratricopeptide (TPR) repeat protein
MRRAIIAGIVLAALGVAGGQAYQAVSQDRQYRRLIAQGDLALQEGQTFAAIEAFSGAIALRPGSMVAFLRRGEAYRQRGELSPALHDLSNASRLDPTATQPLEQLGDVNVALARYERASENYEAALKLDDRSPTVLYKLALASRNQGRFPRAIATLRQAVGLNERFAEAYYLLGVCLRQTGRESEALDALGRAVELSPALIPAREELADLQAAAGRHREEIEQLEALAALDRGKSERLVAVGLAYSRWNRPDLAINALGRAAERYPEQPAVYAAIGRVWLKAAEERGDRAALRKALEALEPVAGEPGATSAVLVLYGRALALSGNLERAERVLLDAASRLPVDPSAFPSLAAVAQRAGHLARARDALVHADALSDEDAAKAGLAKQVGDLSTRMKDYAGAVIWYERATRLPGADALLTGRLADAQFLSGDTTSARLTLTRALQQDPDNPTLLALARRIR